MIDLMVGAEGFEPPTLCSQSRCATRLRYAPTALVSTSTVIKPAPVGGGGRAAPSFIHELNLLWRRPGRLYQARSRPERRTRMDLGAEGQMYKPGDEQDGHGKNGHEHHRDYCEEDPVTPLLPAWLLEMAG